MIPPPAMARSLARSRVLLAGDLILDEYRQGTALGLSAETPTLVACDQTTSFSLGGAGLLCRNLLALGGQVLFVTLLGDDHYERHALEFRHPRLTKLFLRETGRKTTVKSRFWVSGYKLLQWDRLDNRPLQPRTQKALLAAVRRHLPACDKLVISDYRHGLLDQSLAQALVRLARQLGKPVYVDSQVSQSAANHRWYAGATLFCLNRREALAVDPQFEAQPLEAALRRLRASLDAQSLILKLGAEGCRALVDSRTRDFAPPRVEVADTTGAGDAFFAVLALAPSPPGEAHLRLANTWAALSTTLLGAQPPTLEMLQRIPARRR